LVSRASASYTVREPGEHREQESVVVMMRLAAGSSDADELIGMLPKAMVGWEIHGGEQIALLASYAEAEHGSYAASIFAHVSIEGFDEDAR
jgi:hypothetical protein